MKSWNLFEVLILYLKIPLYSTNTTNQPLIPPVLSLKGLIPFFPCSS
jgi:hypothetical protein